MQTYVPIKRALYSGTNVACNVSNCSVSNVGISYVADKDRVVISSNIALAPSGGAVTIDFPSGVSFHHLSNQIATFPGANNSNVAYIALHANTTSQKFDVTYISAGVTSAAPVSTTKIPTFSAIFQNC
jgi:hypothetical protein